MQQGSIDAQSWARVAGLSGTAGVVCYFTAAFVPFPDAVARLLAFAFGPFLTVAFLGLGRYLAAHKDSALLQIATVFGIVGGVMVTTMLVVQVGNGMVRADQLANADGEAAKELIQVAWGAADRVQFLLDVVFDIFICVAVVLFALVMWPHPRFGKIWAIIGVVSGTVLLVLNLEAFPYPPNATGSIDVGPLVALWMLGVFIRALLLMRRPDGQTS